MAGSLDSIRDYVLKHESLPTLSQTLQEVTRLLDDPDTTGAKLAETIGRDPVLTSKVLRQINSAAYGFSGTIGSVQQAVVMLGFNALRGILLSTTVFDLLQSEGMNDLWKHMVATSAATSILAKRHKLSKPEEVAVAGLLHDLGKVILCIAYRDKQSEIQEMIANEQISVREAELELIGVDHGTAASWIGAKWNLPRRILDPIALHHQPNISEGAATETAIVHVADALARATGYGSGGDPYVPQIDEHAFELLELEAGALPEICADLIGSLQEIETMAAMSGD